MGFMEVRTGTVLFRLGSLPIFRLKYNSKSLTSIKRPSNGSRSKETVNTKTKTQGRSFLFCQKWNLGRILFIFIQSLPIQSLTNSHKVWADCDIINISSHAWVIGSPTAEIYSSTMFAVEGLTESMAPTLRPFNIRYLGATYYYYFL